MANQPLAGLKVLDFTTLLPGPLASLLLAEAGADVIKIERPGAGEEMRAYAPRWAGESVNFALLNRGKRALALDLKQPDDCERARALAAGADVVIEQFRPGVMDRLGLGYGALSALNTRLVYCSITGYGQSGPWRDRAGHDLNYQADAGLLGLSMGAPGARSVPPSLLADIAGGAYPAVMNILMALHRRDVTGEGAQLDIAMTENLLPFAFWALGSGFALGQWPANQQGLFTGASPRYRLYDTADGRVAAVAALEPKFWQSFTQAIGLSEEFRNDARDPAATTNAIAAIIAGEDSSHWATVFAAADCCCTVVATLEEASANAHFAARNQFGHRVTALDGTSIPALPMPLDPGFRAGAATEERFPALDAGPIDWH